MKKSHVAVLSTLSCFVCYGIFVLSDAWLGDPLGGPVHGPVPALKSEHSQSVALIVNSYTDAGLTILISLFVVVGFSLRYGHASQHFLSVLHVSVLCLFAVSSVLSFFFATRLKSAYLLQMQFDRINVVLLQPALNFHLLFLLISTLIGLVLVIMALRAQQDTQESHQ